MSCRRREMRRIIISKKRNNMNGDGCQANSYVVSSRAHFCAEVATGAGATDSATGGNGCSCSSGNVVSPFERTLSRTGLVAEFAGEVDSIC